MTRIKQENHAIAKMTARCAQGSHTASILETTWRHSFPESFLRAACRSGKRAINNIYRSFVVPQRESVYVTSTLNTFLRYNEHRHMGGSSTIHRRLTPLPKEPSRISLMYLIFLETRIIHLHFSRWQFVSIFIQFFSDERRNLPQDFSISK